MAFNRNNGYNKNNNNNSDGNFSQSVDLFVNYDNTMDLTKLTVSIFKNFIGFKICTPDDTETETLTYRENQNNISLFVTINEFIRFINLCIAYKNKELKDNIRNITLSNRKGNTKVTFCYDEEKCYLEFNAFNSNDNEIECRLYYVFDNTGNNVLSTVNYNSKTNKDKPLPKSLLTTEVDMFFDTILDYIIPAYFNFRCISTTAYKVDAIYQNNNTGNNNSKKEKYISPYIDTRYGNVKYNKKAKNDIEEDDIDEDDIASTLDD